MIKSTNSRWRHWKSFWGLSRRSLVLLFIGWISSITITFAQNARTIRGIVVDQDETPVENATVSVIGYTIAVSTNATGSFTLQNVPNTAKKIIVSKIGFNRNEVSIDNQNQLRIILNNQTINIEETVVVGYGQQKKESVVGSIVQTTGEVLKRAGGVYSVGAALTGNVPGVITTASTGMPGDEDPLIYLRGQSSWNNASPLVLVDGIERPMNTVDIGSIETISVLKDASATAVFGVKGANGVILITTKRGKEGRADINASIDYNVKNPSRLPARYDAYDARRIRNMVIEREVGLEPGAWDTYTPLEILNKYRNPGSIEEAERYPNVDWTDVMFKDFTHSYQSNINVSGGTPFVKYFAAVDMIREGDIFKEWDNRRGYQAGYGFNRINMRSNLDFQLSPTTMLTANLSSSNGTRQTPWGATGSEYDMWIGAYGVAPDVMLPQYSDGTWGFYGRDPVAATNSVLNLARSGIMKKTSTRINTDFTLNQNLDFVTKGLRAAGTISWDNSFVETERGINDMYNDPLMKWIDPETGQVHYNQVIDPATRFDFQEGISWSPQAGFMDNWATYRKLFYQLKLNYDFSVNNHNFTTMGLFQREQFAGGSEIPNFREDWVFRTTYDYDSRFFAEFNGAYNGSEKFSNANRFNFFSSFAGGWMVSREKFMENLTFIDNLKLRASYGKIGDDVIWRRWLYLTQWAYGGTAKLGQTNNDTSPYIWYREATLGNEDVKWETVTKQNYGLDFSFLNGKIYGSFDRFIDLRNDILIDGNARAVPDYFGAEAPVINKGKVRVKGYELEVNFSQNLSPNSRIWINANMTHAKDQILDADNPRLLPDYRKTEGKQIGQTFTHMRHGYYNNWDELYASTPQNSNDHHKMIGNYYILDFNADGLIDSYDIVPFGFPNRPQNTYNATLGFEWKRFSLFTQWYAVNNVTRQVVFTSFGSRLNNVYDQGEFWSRDTPNGDAPLPRLLTSTDGSTYGDLFMYDGSYLRLKNAEIAYTFDADQIGRFGFKSLRIYLNGNNLFMWTKMPDDRESNFAGTGWASQGAYPTVRRINVGIRANL